MKRLSIAVVGLALLATWLALHGARVQAQPVASITLPDPGGTEQLYPGCNNIALTFENGTPSGTVAQAVAPPDAVQSMWRHDAATSRFEGFSPVAPQASDLLTVAFLDAVWLCVGEAAPSAPILSPPAPTASLPAPTATPAAEQTPAPAASTSPTDVLESFAYALNIAMSMEGDGGSDFSVAMQGLFEAPDRLTCTVSASFGGLTMVVSELVVIAGDAWIDTGDGFRATSAGDPDVMDILGGCPGSPAFWRDFEIEKLTMLPGEPGTVNGVAARQYQLGEAMETLASFGFLPSELAGMTIRTFDIWLAEDGGWPVRLIVDVSVDAPALDSQPGFPLAEGGQGLDMKMQLDITNANSPDIHVEPPGV